MTDHVLPNGHIVKNVPDNVSYKEVLQKAIDNGVFAPMQKIGEVNDKVLASIGGKPEAIIRGLERGVGSGISATTFVNPLRDKPSIDEYNMPTKDYQRIQSDNPMTAAISEGIGKSLPYMLSPTTSLPKMMGQGFIEGFVNAAPGDRIEGGLIDAGMVGAGKQVMDIAKIGYKAAKAASKQAKDLKSLDAGLAHEGKIAESNAKLDELYKNIEDAQYAADYVRKYSRFGHGPINQYIQSFEKKVPEAISKFNTELTNLKGLVSTKNTYPMPETGDSPITVAKNVATDEFRKSDIGKILQNLQATDELNMANKVAENAYIEPHSNLIKYLKDVTYKKDKLEKDAMSLFNDLYYQKEIKSKIYPGMVKRVWTKKPEGEGPVSSNTIANQLNRKNKQLILMAKHKYDLDKDYMNLPPLSPSQSRTSYIDKMAYDVPRGTFDENLPKTYMRKTPFTQFTESSTSTPDIIAYLLGTQND